MNKINHNQRPIIKTSNAVWMLR